MHAPQLRPTEQPPDQTVSDQTTAEEDVAPVTVDEEEKAEPKAKPSFFGKTWRKLGFGAAAVTPKKAKMEEPHEPVPELEAEPEAEPEAENLEVMEEGGAENEPESVAILVMSAAVRDSKS